jgi:outer membrane protein assembly factor BamB
LAESGRILWRQSLKGQITTPPGGDERQIFVATERGIIYLLDADKGRLLWKWKVGDIVSGRIISASGSLFFGTWRGKLLALPLPAEIQR